MGAIELDLWVGEARSSECLNVGDAYPFILAARP